MYAKRNWSLVAAGVVAGLALAACSSETPSEQPPAAPTTATTTAAAEPASQEFGAGCSAVPTDPSNPGSFEAMAKVPVATAASGNPVLSTLVTAVKQAELVDSLNSAEAVTVFAPTNDAFGKIPKADLDKVLADKAILTYHVVPQRLSPQDLAGTHKTLQGGEVKVEGSGTSFTVNGTASVVCGNVQTANATVYIIDAVLMPSS